MRKKKCKVCAEWFIPERNFQPCCKRHEYEYAIDQLNKKRKSDEAKNKKDQREKKRNIKERKEKIKTRQEWIKEAQVEFNSYIRIRDKNKPCVSCGRVNDGSHQRHASHFRSVGSSPHLRFNLLNVHASCATCNNILSGNILNYSVELPKRIGESAYESIKENNDQLRITIEYAKRIKSIFSRRKRLYERVFR